MLKAARSSKLRAFCSLAMAVRNASSDPGHVAQQPVERGGSSLIQSCGVAGTESMMGPRRVEQGALFYNFSIDAHVPADHLLRSIDRFVGLSELRRDLAPFYSSMGRRR
jgi:hypothetical protein